MLSRLVISNFALLESVDIRFEAGLNILTGETGSGKSILMEALGLALGSRVESASILRDPTQKCWIEATFNLPQNEFIKDWLAENALEIEISIENSPEVIIRREILPNGKSRAFLEDSPITLQALKNFSAFLIDFHRQHENLKILSSSEQLLLLDQFSENQTAIKELKSYFYTFNQKQQELTQLKLTEQEGIRKKDYLSHLVEELNAAKLSASEEVELDTALQRLENSELLTTSLKSAVFDFYESETSIQTLLSKHIKAIQKLTTIDSSFKDSAEILENLLVQLEDVTYQLQSKCDEIETDPQRLLYINQRIETYQRLKLKYATKKTAELIQILSNSRQELSQIESISEKIEQTEKELAQIGEKFLEKCYLLEKKRNQTAEHLGYTINQILPELGLPNAQFSIVVERINHSKYSLSIGKNTTFFQSNGINTCSFMVSTNVGVLPASLESVASGGEISRILLAIKTALAQKMQFPCLVFDEIDTGISGSVALQVGLVMEKLARYSQVICITHLPQVASRGLNHYFLYKTSDETSTRSHICKLKEEERVREIAIMLSGNPPSNAAIANAKELLSEFSPK